jgi:hypothetical protein
MRTTTALFRRLSLAAFALLVVELMPSASAATTKPVGNSAQNRPFITLNEAHEERLSALRAERQKFKTGKSTLFQLHQFAGEVLELELRMSNTAELRVAAQVGYRALVSDFEDEAVTAIDRVMVGKWRANADSELERAKRDIQ